MTDRESILSALISSRYWSIKDGETKSQKPLPSAFVVSVLSIIKQVYGPEEMVRAKEDPVGFAWEGDMGQDAAREVATQLWQGKLAGKEACDAGVMYSGPCYAELAHTWSVSTTAVTIMICISSQVRGWGRSLLGMCWTVCTRRSLLVLPSVRVVETAYKTLGGITSVGSVRQPLRCTKNCLRRSSS